MAGQARSRTTRERPSTTKSQRYVLDEQVGFVMRAAMQRHTTIFMSQMIAGLTQPQFAALAKLLDVGPCSQNHLGRLIYLDGATTKGIVDRLRARRFVRTPKDPQDKRRRAIVLTEAGRRITEQAVAVAAKITTETLKPLKQSEQKTILRLLKRLS